MCFRVLFELIETKIKICDNLIVSIKLFETNNTNWKMKTPTNLRMYNETWKPNVFDFYSFSISDI